MPTVLLNVTALLILDHLSGAQSKVVGPEPPPEIEV
jgi:hypothetical protein